MSQFVRKIDPTVLNTYSRLFLDYTAEPSKGIPPYLAGFSGDGESWKKAADAAEIASRDDNPDTWNEVVDEIVSLGGRLGTRREVLEKLHRARTREAFFVVTGQQPGVLGGPLITAHKISTAIALARYLERVTGRPCVPLYWCAADDTDFQEIHELNLLTREGASFSARISPRAHESGLPVGDIALEWLDQVWKNVRRFAGEFDTGGFVTRVIDESFERAKDHGEMASAILVGLFDGRFAVIDGRSTAVRRHAKPVITRYIAHEDDIKKIVAEQGARLEADGYHAQLTVGNDSGVFLLDEGLRKSVPLDLRPVLIDAAENAVEKCSPGVIARTLVQDYALKPLAVVLGPAEIAYRCQTDALYASFGIPRPAAIPRLTATYFPPEFLSPVSAGEGSGIEDMLKDPSRFARTTYGRTLPETVHNAAREFEADVLAAAGRFSTALETGPPSKTIGRIRSGISDIRHRAARTAHTAVEIGKTIALERWPFLSGLESAVRPGGKLQERTLSSLVPFLYGGQNADELISIATVFADDLLDGRVSHIVYSSSE